MHDMLTLQSICHTVSDGLCCIGAYGRHTVPEMAHVFSNAYTRVQMHQYLDVLYHIACQSIEQNQEQPTDIFSAVIEAVAPPTFDQLNTSTMHAQMHEFELNHCRFHPTRIDQLVLQAPQFSCIEVACLCGFCFVDSHLGSFGRCFASNSHVLHRLCVRLPRVNLLPICNDLRLPHCCACCAHVRMRKRFFFFSLLIRTGSNAS
jgi:hypothetical protein